VRLPLSTARSSSAAAPPSRCSDPIRTCPPLRHAPRRRRVADSMCYGKQCVPSQLPRSISLCTCVWFMRWIRLIWFMLMDAILCFACCSPVTGSNYFNFALLARRTPHAATRRGTGQGAGQGEFCPASCGWLPLPAA